jgi:Type II site-specific deoxyribonuclease
MHHSIYHDVPPQGIYFERLVKEAFTRSSIPFTEVKATRRNAPKADIIVDGIRLSLKTETGEGTKENSITITKLCTTEKGPWEAESLIDHALAHLSRYDYILMLRAVWDKPVIHYQLVDIPVSLLKRIDGIELEIVERRKGKQSLATDIYDQGKKAFRILFDAADGKCTVRSLALTECQVLTIFEVLI